MYTESQLGSANQACEKAIVAPFHPTVGENLDRRIAQLEVELARLRAAKISLAPLADMRIQDLRDAMQY